MKQTVLKNHRKVVTSNATSRVAAKKSRHMVSMAYANLRKSILEGTLGPGQPLSQVQLARQFGVSRGPLREAIRMLQGDGLVETQVNHRARVAPFSIDDLEHLYAMRIVYESLAIQVSVPRFVQSDVHKLRGLLQRMDGLVGQDLRQWRIVHRDFHFALIGTVGERMTRTIRELYDHTDRYRSLYIREVPFALPIEAGEHKRIVDSCAKYDGTEAAENLARHLARTALTVLAHHAPAHDPTIVRAALMMATGDDSAATRVNVKMR